MMRFSRFVYCSPNIKDWYYSTCRYVHEYMNNIWDANFKFVVFLYSTVKLYMLVHFRVKF